MLKTIKSNISKEDINHTVLNFIIFFSNQFLLNLIFIQFIKLDINRDGKLATKEFKKFMYSSSDVVIKIEDSYVFPFIIEFQNLLI